jgi:hypothetical protein
MSHDTTHTSAPHQRHTRDLTHKERSEVVINVGSQYLRFVSVIHESSGTLHVRGERVESTSVNLVRRISIIALREGWLPGTQREVPR